MIVHDLVIHPRDRELVIGTHARSIYVMDIAPLEEMTTKVAASDVYLFDVKPATAFMSRPRDTPAAPAGVMRNLHAPNPPFGATIYYQLKRPPPSRRR